MNRFAILVTLKGKAALNAMAQRHRRSRFEFYTLALFLTAAAAGLFVFFYQSFLFLNAQELFGPILMEEVFYLFVLAMSLMLLVSTAVSAYASLFRSREVPYLLASSVPWQDIYFLKLGESMALSSWGFLTLAVPFMAAYGLARTGSPVSSFYGLLFFAPMIFLSAALGTLVALLTAALFPGRKHRRIALAACIILLLGYFLRIQPQLVKEQGSIAGIMSGYLPYVSFSKNALLPSSWACRGILALTARDPAEGAAWGESLFYFLLLLSNAVFFLLPSLAAAQRLYPAVFYRSEDHCESHSARRVRWHRTVEAWIDRFRWPSRPFTAFLEKDIKTFLRDPAEWSQMIIFFGLLLIYFLNLKNLEFHVLKSFWKNAVFVLNTVGTYIVLSSFSMRLVFPMLYLEGSRFWIIHLAPIKSAELLLEKFLLGTAASVLLTVPLILLSGWMLEIRIARIFYTMGLGIFVSIALTGLSVGFGARFANFKTTHPSEIISGFGGSFLLIAHLAYLALIGIFLFFSKDPHWLSFWTAAMMSLLAGIFPLYLGARALDRMEF